MASFYRHTYIVEPAEFIEWHLDRALHDGSLKNSKQRAVDTVERDVPHVRLHKQRLVRFLEQCVHRLPEIINS